MAAKQTLDEFLKTLRAEQLGADGRFLGPQSGTAYYAEGLTPQEFYNAHINDQTDTGKLTGYGDNMATQYDTPGSVSADWVEGPVGNRGLIGGVTDMLSNPKTLMGLAAMGGIGYLGGAFGGAGAASAAGGSTAATPFTASQFAMPGAMNSAAALGGADLAALTAGGGAMGATGVLGSAALPSAAIAGAAAPASGLLSSIGGFLGNSKNLLSLGGAALGALSAKDSTQSSSQSRDPWGPAQAYLKDNLATNAAAQEYYRANPFTNEQKTAYQGLLNTNANNQLAGNGLLANANNFMQSRRGVMPTMQAMPTNTQAAPIDWSQYQNIGRR